MTSNAFLFRQVALVSYGTQFLRQRLSLDDWYRHGVFRDAGFQFRALDGNRLLADYFTVWLHTLARDGARRLSLHPAAQLALDADYALVVHFDGRYQVWSVGVEQPAWEEGYDVASARSYAGAIDSYWLTGERQGDLPVAATNWKALAATIATDLDMNVPSSNVPVPTGPFFPYVPEDQGWERLPLFPSAPRAALAHRIVATLVWRQGQFANDTHPKNEGNLYLGLDQEGADRLQHWGRRLDAWLIDVLLRSANEDGEISMFRPIRPPVAPAQPIAASTAGAASSSGPPAAEADSAQPGKRGCLVTLLVLGLLVAALFWLSSAKACAPEASLRLDAVRMLYADADIVRYVCVDNGTCGLEEFAAQLDIKPVTLRAGTAAIQIEPIRKGRQYFSAVYLKEQCKYEMVFAPDVTLSDVRLLKQQRKNFAMLRAVERDSAAEWKEYDFYYDPSVRQYSLSATRCYRDQASVQCE